MRPLLALRCCAAVGGQPDQALPAAHPASGKTQIDGKATAYLCRGQTCSLPLTDEQELRKALLV